MAIDNQSRTLLVVCAHPDDECFNVAGTLARYVDEGIRTVLVTCTAGEAGEISDPSLATPENLGEVRRREMAESVRILKISRHEFLGYRDSGMAGTIENDDLRSFERCNLDEATGRLVAIIRQERPQVIVAHNEQGDYGHPDHRKGNIVTVAAFYAAGDPQRFPEAGAPWAPSKLYYGAFPRSIGEKMGQAMRAAGIDGPFTRPTDDADERPRSGFGTPDELVTTAIDVSGYTDRKHAAALAHKTQFGPQHFIQRIPAEIQADIGSHEHFQLVIGPRPPTESGHEDDLFQGLKARN